MDDLYDGAIAYAQLKKDNHVHSNEDCRRGRGCTNFSS